MNDTPNDKPKRTTPEGFEHDAAEALTEEEDLRKAREEADGGLSGTGEASEGGDD